MGNSDRPVGENRCWPCTVTNAVAATFIAGVPLLAALLRGDLVLLAVTVGWTFVVTGYTTYRLVTRGYLPGSETIAKRTGLHERIGPDTPSDGTNSGSDSDDRGE